MKLSYKVLLKVQAKILVKQVIKKIIVNSFIFLPNSITNNITFFIVCSSSDELWRYKCLEKKLIKIMIIIICDIIFTNFTFNKNSTMILIYSIINIFLSFHL